MHNRKINVCFSSDDNYTQHLGVAMVSILKNAHINDEYNFFIMDGGISIENQNKLKQLKRIKDFQITFVKMDDSDFETCPITDFVNYITLPTYYRFKIPSLFPNIDKILYLDCDLITRTNIAPLFDTDISNYYIAAIPEVFNHLHKERLGLKPDEYYCNAGVLLINNKKWREDNIEQKLFDYTIHPVHKIIHVDQDVINDTMKGHIKYLNLKWNLQHDTFFYNESYLFHQKEKEEAIKNPYIVHYTNKFKPWKGNCLNPYKHEYEKYLKLTPWKKYLPKLYIEKLLYKITSFFYCKQKNHGKTKIKIFGIPVYKKTNWNYTTEKYLFGIRFYKKKDNFAILNDKLNNIIDTQLQNQLQMQKLAYAINSEVSKSLAVYNLHQKVFPKYKNINKGKDVVLVATGPSLNGYMPIDNTINIGVNKAFQYNKIKFDYLFLQDYSGLTKSFIEDFLHYDTDSTKKFIGFINNDEYPASIIPDKYSDFKNVERYYTLNPNILNQFNYDISCHAFAEFNSIVFPAMQFILWTNPKRIYLVGCDCSLNGYYDSKDKNNLATQKVIEGWKKLKKFAQIYYPDTEIISINPVGLKGIFKDEYQKETIKAN